MSTVSLFVQQEPQPGDRRLKFRGDTLTIQLVLSRIEPGKAFLRTNIGHADSMRREITREVHYNEPLLARDWFDLPMTPVRPDRFRITVPLCDVGHFEAKAFFIPDKTQEPIWPSGDNLSVNVAPADTVCANVIYNAFVRQFGPNISGGFFTPETDDDIQGLDKLGYAVIPPSGTFRDMIPHLDFIIKTLGCRYIQMLPIHPTPTTYGRMGRFGSPYAALSFTTVDPALARFDPKATPTEQFIELVDAIHARKAKMIIDIAINHTGWAAILHDTHPEWLCRTQDGRIEVPGAWGVQWEDLAKLDYSNKALWSYMGRVLLTWCRRGVDGFRCDAGYMIPVAAWKYLIALVREQFPDTLFFLEGLGGKFSVTRELLNSANFNWAYSELFQNYNRSQIERYIMESSWISGNEGVLIHYAETHDNNRLASRSLVWAKMRTALCALLSHQGGFAFANGVEWLATEKIDVHGARSLNWGATPNQVTEIKKLARLLSKHPAFFDEAILEWIAEGEGNFLAMHRFHRQSGKHLIIVANLDDNHSVNSQWRHAGSGIKRETLVDLLAGEKVKIQRVGEFAKLHLDPGKVFCLSDDDGDMAYVDGNNVTEASKADRTQMQCLRAKVFDVWRCFHRDEDLGDFDVDAAATALQADPEAFCRSMNPYDGEPCVIAWTWPRDETREVMIPPSYFLLIRSPFHFRAMILRGARVMAIETSLPGPDGGHFALISPKSASRRPAPHVLHLTVFSPEGCRKSKAPLLYLNRFDSGTGRGTVRRRDLGSDTPLMFLTTNRRGGMARAPIDWGRLTSRYDALLAANFNPKRPSDRWILWARCRGWVVFQDYSQEIDATCFDQFYLESPSQGAWRFKVPTGLGNHVMIRISVSMDPDENRTRMVITRENAAKITGSLSDAKVVKIILRPDIESRSFHDVTKAFLGSENHWPRCIGVHENGFDFSPDPQRGLALRISKGRYVHEPEWHYMVYRPQEARRGQDPDSDLFSPGYFTFEIGGGEAVTLTGTAIPQETLPAIASGKRPKRNAQKKSFHNGKASQLLEGLLQNLDHYLTERDLAKTVIAGYPWFLDWGRDSLIFTRGLIAADRLDEAKSILCQFGRFENQGMLPNMIGEQGPANWDTSDAPLWFIIGCRDLAHAKGGRRFLETPCGKRTLRQVLSSIVESYILGTPNGIQMDGDTGLIFSPAHFTWMDTNHPAATPREGYPIEIQALWYAALDTISSVSPAKEKSRFHDLAARVRASVQRLFPIDGKGYLSDCLHGKPGTGAARSEPDDALRPNQIFAVTMGLTQDPKVARDLLDACRELLVPGAVRSLANRPLATPLNVLHHGRVLIDPYNPYQGKYEGDEDTRRKPAYHNGTAWTWPFPSYCEAYAMVYPKSGKTTALSMLSSTFRLMREGCIGHIPEIADGDFPHRQRGCDAQAWSISEWIRVWIQLASI